MYNELIDALRYCADEDKICTRKQNCGYYGKGFFCQDVLMLDAADALEAAEKRIAELEDELMFQLDTRRKETAEIERLKAENLKLQKQNRDCGWNCKQCEYVDKDLQAEEAEQRLMELDRKLYELRSFNARMKGEKTEWIKCSERLPYDDQMVLVPIIEKDIPCTEILICRYIKSARMFRHYGFRGIKDFTEVTHWMPLPDAPEVEGCGSD